VNDAIHIQELELFTTIGVPDEERDAPQRLVVNLTLYPARGLAGLEDKVENTVDYFDVCQAVINLARARERRLIETLAEEIGKLLLGNFPLSAVEIELRKFIIPETAYIAVIIRREVSN
jgi:dihydroneopterin aldolase